MKSSPLLCVVGLVAACGAPKPPDLQLAVPSKLGPNGTITVTATARTGAGEVGAGTVNFSATDGTFTKGEAIALDSFGTAETTFSCAPSCAQGTSFTITAKWTSKEGLAEAIGRTRVETPPIVTDGGTTGTTLRTAQDYLPSCASTSRPELDEVTVTGTIEGIGTLNARVKNGNSAGQALGPTGGQFFTGGAWSGSPTNLQDVGLWLWPSTTQIESGVLYRETNTRSGAAEQFMNFRVRMGAGASSMNVTCPAGAGEGTLVFQRLMFFPGDGGYSSGAYTFSCPDAGISVAGCFAYR